jgi:hypothetical protein
MRELKVKLFCLWGQNSFLCGKLLGYAYSKCLLDKVILQYSQGFESIVAADRVRFILSAIFLNIIRPQFFDYDNNNYFHFLWYLIKNKEKFY